MQAVALNSAYALPLNQVEPSGTPPMKFLPISIDGVTVITPVFSADIPSPSVGSKDTLAGRDQDSDGVRDDVERYVARRFLQSPNIREALYTRASGLQSVILDGHLGTKGIAEDALDSAKCLEEIEGLNKEERENIEARITGKMLNTYERSSAYAENIQKLTNHVSNVSAACE